MSDKKYIHIQYYKTKYANYILGSFEDRLCLVDSRNEKKRKTIDDRLKRSLNADFIEQDDEILQRTKKELDEYFNLQRKEFDIPLIMVGTDFQKRVWNALMKIPYGTTSTYLQLAKDIGHKKAVRAVANANGANPIGIIIPCHRIIGSDGRLTGYAGGLPLKRSLLELEKIYL